MENSVIPSGPIEPLSTASVQSEAAGRKLAALLENLDEAPQGDAAARHKAEVDYQNKLIQVRLGVASALFTALRAKHAPTASHSLRVALGCSSWALMMDITEEERDEIEVAALLHDVGKVGVPDSILQKPGKLTHDEAVVVDRHRQSGLEILTACSASREILDIVYYATAWFDGSKNGFDRSEKQLPLGARMIAIVDAFDSMTTDHVYRRAMSRERAMAELFECAGSQFDPALVKDFCGLLGRDQVKLNANVMQRWLQELHTEASNALWCLGRLSNSLRDVSIDSLFQQKLVDSMHDAVVFVDGAMKILLWNRAAERLTGIQSAAVLQKQWVPSLVDMRDERERDISDAECPVLHAIQSSVQNNRRLTIAGRKSGRIAVDAHMVPVVGRDGVSHGATLLLHDASSQITLEERVETLHVKATQDPLTQIANRAEFDRTLSQFVSTHLEQGLPCSLIVCDLDFFKKINDNFGHQAGDEALISFASLLKRLSRPGDLVARYGGEEFVVLCADCDNATATARAEEIRRELEELPQSSLNGKSITASFGVTEIQAGDTPETMFRRADRALLQAKDLGRNTVVQLGSGINDQEQNPTQRGWLSWLRSAPPEQILQRALITAVPLNVVVEKLRGFVADHHAKITEIDDEHVTLHIDGQHADTIRRRNDRSVPFLFQIQFEEIQAELEGRSGGNAVRTVIKVSVCPIRNRDRRSRNVVDRARQLVVSLKSYLMAQEFTGTSTAEGEQDDSQGVLNKAKHILLPMLNNDE